MVPYLFIYSDVALLFLRIVVGIIFIAHGRSKWKNIHETVVFFDSVKLSPGLFWARFVGGVEMLGGLCVAAGFFTHIAAALLAAVVAVAIGVVKRTRGLVGGYEFELLLFAAAFTLVSLGGGSYALDALRPPLM